jgi:hypothetical protein
MSTVQRLAPAASSAIQYFGGFIVGSILGTGTYFYLNRETVTLGEEFGGLATRFRWASNPNQVSFKRITFPFGKSQSAIL